MLNWLLGFFDPHTLIAVGLTFFLGTFLKNAAYAKIKDTLRDIENTLHDINEADADDKWTKEELMKVISDVKHIIGDWQK